MKDDRAVRILFPQERDFFSRKRESSAYRWDDGKVVYSRPLAFKVIFQVLEMQRHYPENSATLRVLLLFGEWMEVEQAKRSLPF